MNFLFIGGPCVVEDYKTTYRIAEHLKRVTRDLGVSFLFKASYDKANRTAINSFRGLPRGIEILGKIKAELGIRVISDVHRVSEVKKAAYVLDVMQIPAFLCRQTDLILEVAKTGKPMNVKKGQFMAPADMQNVVDKIHSVGGKQIYLTERGTTFGYNNLVVDMRGIKIMQRTGYPVIFDATHSCQLPGSGGNMSGGNREYAPILAKAAVAAGADGVFMECHPDPDMALCDGPNSVRLDNIRGILERLVGIYQLR